MQDVCEAQNREPYCSIDFDGRLVTKARIKEASAASTCFIGAAHMEKTFKRRLQDGLVGIAVSKTETTYAKQAVHRKKWV